MEKGTNKKGMRKLLNKCCALMKVAFDNGLDMDINIRGADKDKPWIVGYVYEEDCDFTKNDGRHLNFTMHNFCRVDENEAELSAVEEYIENHKK